MTDETTPAHPVHDGPAHHETPGLPPLLAAARAIELDRDATIPAHPDFRRGMTRAIELLRLLDGEEQSYTAPAGLRERIAAAIVESDGVPSFEFAAQLHRAAALREADAVLAVLREVVATAVAKADGLLYQHLSERDRRYPRKVADAVLAAPAADTATLATALEGLHTLIATSSRDWSEYRVDAWLWAVLCGWDCEDDHEHDGMCDQGAAMAETALRHGWDADTVAKARRYRAAVRRAIAAGQAADRTAGEAS